MFSFGKTSLTRLSTCSQNIQKLMLYAIITSPVDFGIGTGHRSPEEQFELYKVGRKKNSDGKWMVINPKAVLTNVDGFLKKSDHNQTPSTAVDIFAWIPGKKHLMYDDVHLAFLGGHILKCAKELKLREEIDCNIRWGGNWDGDGEIIYDQSLKDLPHYEES